MAETWWTQTVREGLEGLVKKKKPGLPSTTKFLPKEYQKTAEKALGENTEELLHSLETGGILKPYAIGKTAGQLAEFLSRWRIHPSFRKAQTRRFGSIIKELFDVPQKEFGRIENMEFSNTLSPRGRYGINEKQIQLGQTANPETIWHEFAHARNWNPDPGLETSRAMFLRWAESKLKPYYKAQEFYYKVDPTEQLARAIGKTVPGTRPSAGVYDELFGSILGEVAYDAEQRILKKLGPAVLRDIKEKSAWARNISTGSKFEQLLKGVF